VSFPAIRCPAIVVFDFGSGLIEDIKLAFRCLRLILRIPQFYDKWAKIDAKAEGWTESMRYLNGATSRLEPGTAIIAVCCRNGWMIRRTEAQIGDARRAKSRC
jgi:hypothetical protein